MQPTEGIQQGLNIKVIMQLLTLVTPYFIVFFFVLLSILNSNIKGFVYLFGLIIVYSIISVFKETLPSNPQSNQICSIFGNYHGNSPSFITALYTYTFIYMLLPMTINNTFNIPLLILLLVMIFIDYLIRSTYFGCIDYRHIIMGGLVGSFVSFLWTYSIKQSGQPGLLFYDEILSNKETCTKNSGKFKCKLYKGGELVGSIPSPNESLPS